MPWVYTIAKQRFDWFRLIEFLILLFAVGISIAIFCLAWGMPEGVPAREIIQVSC